MSRIIVLYDLMEPPVEITQQFFQRFKEIYKCNVSFIKSSDIKTSDIESCRVLIVIRSQNMFLAYIAGIVKRSGRLSAAMYDDDFLAIKDFHIRRRIQEKAIIKTLKNTSVLFSTNIYLLQKYGDIGGVDRRIKTDTGVGIEEIKRPLMQQNHEGKNLIKVVYYCNDGTTVAFDNVVGNCISEIIKKYGDIFDWSFIGTKPVMNKCVDEKHVHYIEHLTLEEFRNELRNGDYEFGIAPLLENEFSRHKYINKFMEFTTAGIPCIYSNVTPYSEFIVDRTDGILCSNSTLGWIDAFGYMICEDNRQSIIFNAQRRIIEEFSIESLSRKIVEAVPEMINEGYFNAPKKIDSKIMMLIKVKSFFYTIIDPFCRAIGRAKVEGIRSLLYYSFLRLIKHEGS